VTWAIGAVLAGAALAAAPRLDWWRARPRWARAAAAAAGALVAFAAAGFAAFVLGELRAGGQLVAVSEMRPAWEFPSIGLPFLAVTAAGGALAWGRPEGRAARLAVWAVAAVLGAAVVRNVGLAALAMIPGVAAAGEDAPAPGRPGRAGVAALAAAVALALLMAVVLSDRDDPAGAGVDWRRVPRSAAEVVRTRLEAPVFNSWDWGGYLDWAWEGAPRTFLDGRLGDRARLAEHDAIVAGDPGPVLDGQGIRTALLRPVWGNSGRLVPAVWWFLRHPEWRLVDASDGLVFARIPLPAGVAPLPAQDAWPAVIRAVELAEEQRDLPVHAEFTRAMALLELGRVPEARAAFERGRAATPEVARQYLGLDAVLARFGR
jgi:hypothetical protein